MIAGVLLACAFACFALAAVFARGDDGPSTLRRLMAAGIVFMAAGVIAGVISIAGQDA